jgi:hypothetical protein
VELSGGLGTLNNREPPDLTTKSFSLCVFWWIHHRLILLFLPSDFYFLFPSSHAKKYQKPFEKSLALASVWISGRLSTYYTQIEKKNDGLSDFLSHSMTSGIIYRSWARHNTQHTQRFLECPGAIERTPLPPKESVSPCDHTVQQTIE